MSKRTFVHHRKDSKMGIHLQLQYRILKEDSAVASGFLFHLWATDKISNAVSNVAKVFLKEGCYNEFGTKFEVVH